jgi:DnaJ-class molecular chaperone
MSEKDFYAILELPRTATGQEIKKSYRRLALRYHPDHNQGNEESTRKFQEVNEANEILGDEKLKRVYDSYGTAAVLQYQKTGIIPGNPFVFSQFSFGGMGDGHDPFSAFFHGEMFTNVSSKPKEPPIHHNIDITLEMLYKNNGTVETIIENVKNRDGAMGKRHIKLTIKKFSDFKKVIRLEKKGHMSNDEKRDDGDISITLTLHSHAQFQPYRENDLVVYRKLPWSECIHGRSAFSILFLDGTEISINATLSPTRPGRCFVLDKEGLRLGDTTGKIFLVFDTDWPHNQDLCPAPAGIQRDFDSNIVYRNNGQ